MASRRRPGSLKYDNLDEVARRLAELELENKTLRQKLGKGGGGSAAAVKEAAGMPEPPLTPAQKEALIAGLVSRLSSLAQTKIDSRVRSMFKKTETKSQFEGQMVKINMRIDLSWGELLSRSSGRSPSARRPRAASRSRVTD